MASTSYPYKQVDGISYDGQFPSQDVSPEIKRTKDYALAWCRSMFWGRDIRSGYWRGQYEKWVENRLYMQGRQPIARYMERFGIENENDESYMNVDWTPVAIAPKFVDIMTSIIAKRITRLRVESIDPLATSEKDEKVARKFAEIILKPLREKIESEFNVPLGGNPPKDEPQSIEEMQLYMQSGSIRLAEEIAMEMGLELVFQDSDWEQILKELVEDFLACGMGTLWDRLDESGRLVVEREMPERCVFDYSEKWDWADARFGGRFIRFGEADLKLSCQGELTNAEISEAIKAGINVDPLFFWSPSYYGMNMNYDQKATVMQFWFKTTESFTYEEMKTRFGTNVIKKRDFNYEPPKDSQFKKKKLKIEIPIYYQGYWVVGTDMIYGYDKVYNQGRDRYYKTHPPQKVMMHRNTYGDTTPIASRITTWIDDLQINWLQYQNARAKEPPPGVQINETAFINSQLGKGKPLSTTDIMKLLTQNGSVPYNGTDPITGDNLQMYPISPIGVNFAPYLQSRVQGMQIAIDMIRQTLGFNEATDASTQNPKALVGISQISAAATDNAIWPLASAISKLHCMAGDSIICRLRGYVATGNPYTGYMKKSIGDAVTVMRISIGEEADKYDYGTYTEEVMTEAEEMRLEEMIQTQLAIRTQTGQGGLELEDAFMIRRMRHNLKLAEQMLIYRKKERALKDEEKSAMLMQKQAEAQAQQGMAVEQVKQQGLALEMQKIELEANAKIRVDKEMEEEKRKTLIVEYALKGQLQGMTIQEKAIADAIVGLELQEEANKAQQANAPQPMAS